MRFADRTLEPFGKTFFDMVVPTQLSLKTPLVLRMINELIGEGCLPERGDPYVELVFDEALANAMVRGNKLDVDKTIRIRLFADLDRWGAIIDDEGRGFSLSDLPRNDDPESVFKESGRGIRLMDAYLDELIYNPRGNSVMLVRRIEDLPVTEERPVEPEPELASVPAEPVRLLMNGPVAVVAIYAPRLSDDNLEPVRSALAEAAETAAGVVVDMHRVGFLSSSVIGAFMGTYRALRRKSGTLILTALQPVVLDIFKAVALDRVITFTPDTDEAVAELKRKLGAG